MVLNMGKDNPLTQLHSVQQVTKNVAIRVATKSPSPIPTPFVYAKKLNTFFVKKKSLFLNKDNNSSVIRNIPIRLLHYNFLFKNACLTIYTHIYIHRN